MDLHCTFSDKRMKSLTLYTSDFIAPIQLLVTLLNTTIRHDN